MKVNKIEKSARVFVSSSVSVYFRASGV